MNYDDFEDLDDFPATHERELTDKQWRREVDRVIEAYVKEFEMCRTDMQALRLQVNELALTITELKR